MKGKHHTIGGFATGICIVASEIILNQVYNPFLLVGSVALSTIGGLFPDIDTRTSKLGKKMKITSFVASKMFGHRGFLHSPIFVIGMFFLLRLIFKNHDWQDYQTLYYAFCLGIVNHLFCDMTTKGGIPILYPFNMTKFNLSRLKSGSKYEPFILGVILFIMIGVTFYLCFQHIGLPLL